ncbi:N-acetyltransferase family protein [Embleya sp. AB8]|uniref:GNAT family N-acetyltransferase n=1 Tax=Embleya sp. AB8 TaxID=3156304 RepID=UPI003C7957BE
MTLTITHAEPADTADLVSLVEALETHYGVTDFPPLAARLEQTRALLFGPTPAARVLLARDDTKAVALAAYSYLWPAVGTAQSLYLKELFVLETHRRRGVAGLLMRELQSIAGATGCVRIEWTAQRDNDAALKFYAALGAAVNDDKAFHRLVLDR